MVFRNQNYLSRPQTFQFATLDCFVPRNDEIELRVVVIASEV